MKKNDRVITPKGEGYIQRVLEVGAEVRYGVVIDKPKTATIKFFKKEDLQPVPDKNKSILTKAEMEILINALTVKINVEEINAVRAMDKPEREKVLRGEMIAAELKPERELLRKLEGIFKFLWSD